MAPAYVLGYLTNTVGGRPDGIATALVFGIIMYGLVWLLGRIVQPALLPIYAHIEQRLQTDFIVSSISGSEGVDSIARAKIGDAELSFAIDNGAEGVRNATWALYSGIFAAVLSAAVGVVLTVVSFGWFAAVLLLFTSCVFTVISVPFVSRHQSRNRVAMNSAMRSFGVLQNTLEFWRESRIYGVGSFLRQRYRADRKKFESDTIRAYVATTWLQVVQACVVSIGLVAMLLSVSLGAGNSLQPGTLVTLSGVAIAALLPLQSLGFGVSQLSVGLSQIRQSSDSLNALLASSGRSIRSVSRPGAPLVRWSRVTTSSLDGSFRLEVPAATLKPGRPHWVVGPSGAGKSVVLDSLCGLGPVAMGDLTIEHRSGSIGLAYLRQSAPVLDDSIEVNVSLGRAERDTVRRLLVSSGLFDLESAAERGLDQTARGEGSRLSGGQERRMLLARTLLSGPAFVVLDEPTTGLDRASRRRIWTTISEASATKVVLVATHDSDAPFAEGDCVLTVRSEGDEAVVSIGQYSA
jgi:ABC-type transport system involved in cytochrome bd biosynthesis fused ATPase/permease subunit